MRLRLPLSSFRFIPYISVWQLHRSEAWSGPSSGMAMRLSIACLIVMPLAVAWCICDERGALTHALAQL